ncbi:MAG: ABC transporter permease [Actinomycetota bacterium]|nr:ABC transporter permease [Actinomycetota bacterium]
MSVFLSYTVIGVALGAIYAITATGLVVTYTTTGVFNFAHGAVGMVAAFSFYQLWQAWHWPLLAALAVVLVVEAPLLAVLVETVLMRRLHGASTERSLMVTLGLLVILMGVATALWNPLVSRTVPPFFGTDSVRIAGVYVSAQQILTVAVVVLMAVALRWFFRTLRVGVAMRAVVDDPELVAMAGAKPYRVAQMGWMLGFFLAALAGCLLAPTVASTGLSIEQLTLLVVNGYAAAVVGRLRNVPLTVAGGIVLGLVTEYCVGYLPTAHLNQNLVAVIPEAVPVVFLFVVLLVIPAARLVAGGRLPVHTPPRVPRAARSWVGAAVLVALAAAVSPLLGGIALATVATGLALGIVGVSLVLLTGYAGQVSLCQLTFLGVGAFTMGKISGGGGWPGLVAGVGVSAALGALIALPTLRLRGLYLALATLAFGEAAYYAFFSNPSFFPGYGGDITVRRLALPGLAAPGDRLELVEIAVVLALCAVAVLAVRRSRFGRRLVALNDSPAAFATLGMSSRVAKVGVFALSAGIAGLGGCLYAGEQGAISANDVLFFSSLTLLLFVAIWGVRTVTGGILGGLTAAALPVAAAHLPHALADLSGLVAGVGIVLLSRFPDGVLGLPAVSSRVRRAWPREPSPELSTAATPHAAQGAVSAAR